VLVFNHGCEQLTGWPAAEVIGKTCLYQNEPNPGLIASLTGALCPPPVTTSEQSEQVIRKQVLILRKDGTSAERCIHFVPLIDAESQTTAHTLGVITPCSPEAPDSPTPNLEIARHTADLRTRFGVTRLIARSPSMQRVAAQIELARSHLSPVHLVGEKGTGREHVARLIHYSGPQKNKRFVPLRCATASHLELQQTLQRLQEDITGHDDVGAVYLDDISHLPGDLQPIVMSQLLQSHRRWFSSSERPIDLLPDELFHPQLKTGLTPLVIAIPPLRDRMEDLKLLAQQILEECNSLGELQHTEFSQNVLRLFHQHSWPGNVDEFSTVIAKACEHSRNSVVDVADLPMQFTASLQARTLRPLTHSVSLDEQVAQFETTRIQEAMKEARGNKSLAAEKLGIPRAKLYRRMEQLGLHTPEDDTGIVVDE